MASSLAMLIERVVQTALNLETLTQMAVELASGYAMLSLKAQLLDQKTETKMSKAEQMVIYLVWHSPLDFHLA